MRAIVGGSSPHGHVSLPCRPLGCGFYTLIRIMAVAAAAVAFPLGVLSHDVCLCQEVKGFSGSG